MADYSLQLDFKKAIRPATPLYLPNFDTLRNYVTQIAEFVRFLAAQQKGLLVLAVPWPAAVTARRTVEEYLNQFEATNVEGIILDGFQGRAAAGPAY